MEGLDETKEVGGVEEDCNLRCHIQTVESEAPATRTFPVGCHVSHC